MRKFFAFLLLAAASLATTSCSNKDDGIYVSTSGEGSIIINYDSPIYLYRMVLFSQDDEQQLYLMGNTAYVDGEANFMGRGAVVMFTMPNELENTALAEMTFDIGDEGHAVSYSPYVNYMNAEREDDFVDMLSGTVLIRRSGQYYDVRLIGSDVDENNLLISYRGYIYRAFDLLSDGDDE